MRGPQKQEGQGRGAVKAEEALVQAQQPLLAWRGIWR